MKSGCNLIPILRNLFLTQSASLMCLFLKTFEEYRALAVQSHCTFLFPLLLFYVPFFVFNIPPSPSLSSLPASDGSLRSCTCDVFVPLVCHQRCGRRRTETPSVFDSLSSEADQNDSNLARPHHVMPDGVHSPIKHHLISEEQISIYN